ncbi:MAG: GNAT family N-acetyltransferase [Haloferacaceae archaeon]
MAAESVTVRPYEAADRDGFLSLYHTVWGHPKGRDWFAWRFERNPYRDGVQMVVAEADGEVVGVEPLLPFRLRAGATTVDAYQPVDWLVHPDFRRQGIFTRMTEALLERYAGTAALLFNFPNDALLPGLEGHGWRLVGEVPSRYRLQNPERLVSSRADALPGAVATLARAGSAFERLERLLDRTVGVPADASVSRVDGVAAGDLAERYAASPPARIHVPREEAFLSWRYGNPRWETETYLASRDGEPAAGVVAATERVRGATCTHLVDVQPMDAPECADALRALLAAVVRDHRDVDLLRAPAGLYARVFRRFWFLADTSFPFSRVATTSRLAIRPLASRDEGADGSLRKLGGRRLTDPDEWLLLPGDLDIE